LERLAINVPTTMPVAKPKAYIPILTGEETSLHNVTDDETAMMRKSNAIPMSALFDFILFLLLFSVIARVVFFRPKQSPTP